MPRLFLCKSALALLSSKPVRSFQPVRSHRSVHLLPNNEHAHVISNACLAPPFPGVGLSAGNAVFAEIQESPETTPNAIIMEDSVADAVTEDAVEIEADDEVAKVEIDETVSELVGEGGDSAVSPATSVSPATLDPLVLGGGAATVVAAVGAVAAMTQNSDENAPEAVIFTPRVSKAAMLKEVRDTTAACWMLSMC